MAKYQAILMHGERGGEGRYVFEGNDDLLKKSPMKVLRLFMEHLDKTAGLGHIDYEVNAAMKNKEKGVITALGNLDLGNDTQPFVCMISHAD